MKAVSKMLTGLVLSTISAIAPAKDALVVEWAPFYIVAGTTDENLINAADQVTTDFLGVQPGFIKRELVKKSAEEYADIVYWRDRESAVAAGNKVEKCGVCATYFKLMDMQASGNSGAGFAHYSIIKTW
jgi:hypothetical protein